MNYTLNQLQIFLKVTQTLSITKAAEELNLTQPAVSIQLKNFQNQFEIPLTEVIGRQLYVTDFGLEIAGAAEKIINEVYAINFKTKTYKGQLAGRLKLAVVSTGKYVMPYFLTDFLTENPGVELVMDVTNKSKVIESLVQNETDFALVSVLPDGIPIENCPLMENKLYLVSNPKLSESVQSMNQHILEELPLIYREEGSATRKVMEQFLHQNQLKVHKKLELTTNEAVKQAVMAGIGFSIMPLIGIRNEIHLGLLKIIPIEGLPLTSTWQLIWIRSKKLTPVSVAFLTLIEARKEAIIARDFE